MAEAVYKTCTKCGLERPVTDFRADKQKKDGLYSSCRTCCRAKERERYANDPDFRQWTKDYRYRNPDVVRRNELRQRTVNREAVVARKKDYYERTRPERLRKSSEYQQLNKESCYARQRQWRIDNHDKKIASVKAWQAKNPEKAKASRKASFHNRRAKCKGGVTGPELRAWVSVAPKQCHWCNKRLTEKTLTVDHYVPLALGGKHEVTNFVPACRSCNCKKNAKDPLAFAREIGRLF